MLVGKYSLVNLMNQYNAHSAVIHSYLSGGDVHTSSSTVAGLSIGLFLTLLVLAIAMFVWAVYAIIKYAKYMPEWAVVLSVVFLFFGGSAFSLILVYATKKDQLN